MENHFLINFIYIRDYNKLSQTEMADRLGVSRDVVSAIENNRKKSFTIDFILKVATEFEVPVGDLVATDMSLTGKGYVLDGNKAVAVEGDSRKHYDRIIAALELAMGAKDQTIASLQGAVRLADDHNKRLEVMYNQTHKGHKALESISSLLDEMLYNDELKSSKEFIQGEIDAKIKERNRD